MAGRQWERAARRRNGGWKPGGKSLRLLAAFVMTVAIGGIAPLLMSQAANATVTGSGADSCLSEPLGTYTPQIGVVDLDNFSSETGQQLTVPMYCGVANLEDNAYELYAESHGLSPGDPAITEDGTDWIAGTVWSQVEAIAYAENEGDTSGLTPDQVGAYQWYQALLKAYDTEAAQDAVNEYNKWNNEQCNYRPPNTTVFSFNPDADPSCDGGETALLEDPTPPTYQEFVAFGAYDAQQGLGLNIPGDNPAQQFNTTEAIENGAADGTALLVGGGVVLARQVNPSFGADFFSDVFPCRSGTCTNKTLAEQKAALESQSAEKTMQSNQEITRDEELVELDEAEGEPPDVALDDDIATDAGGIDLTGTAGVDVEAAVESAASVGDVGAIVSIAFVAATVLVSQAINIATETQIPGQLQQYLSSQSGTPDVWSSIYTGGGDLLPFTLFESQLDPTDISGQGAVATPPSSGDVFEVSTPSIDGYPGNEQLTHSTELQTWPIGPDAGGDVYLAPTSTFYYANGSIFRSPTPDEKLAGQTSGYLPTGEIDYFNWQHGEQTALVDGNQFVNLTAPGSIDVGGADTGAACVQANSCEVTPTIEALNQYGQDINLSIVPDPGTIATAEIKNQDGNNAGTQLSGPSDGLVAGQTVTLSDPETSPVGAATTYEWQLETHCPYDQAHPVRSNDGVPFCYGSPEYDLLNLPSTDEDLQQDGVEDPAFHGDPVSVRAGQSISVTWPGPGTYHVRLITTDAYGVTHQYDENVTVVDQTPELAITTPSGWAGADAIGPVPNGGSVTLNGCIESPSAEYGNPQVSVAWGDGDTDTASALSGGSSNITFAFETSSPCASDWSFSATHTYLLSTPAALAQEAAAITVSDGFGDSFTDNLGIDVSSAMVPSFTSPAEGTLTTGQVGTIDVTATGDPTPTITESGALPQGIGFGDSFTGSAHVGDGGSYPITLTATNSNGTATQSFTLFVNDAPVFSGPTSANMTVGADSTVSIPISGFPTPNVSVYGTVPSGLIEQVGQTNDLEFSGTPSVAEAGSYPLTIVATSPVGTASEAFTLNIVTTPVITSGAVADLTTGSDSSFGVSATGTPTPSLSITSGTLPDGISFEDFGNGTGAFYGTATSSGTTDVTLTASNASGSVSQQVTINTSTSGGPPITSPDSANFEVGTNTTFDVTSSDPNAVITCGECSTNLPAGLTFTGGTGSATISGTPAAGTAGLYAPLIFAADGGTTSEFISLTDFGTPVFTSPDSATFSEGEAETFNLAANAWPLAEIYYLPSQNALPAGLSLTSNSDGTGTISGTPDAGSAGTYDVTVYAENTLDIGNPVSQQLVVHVNHPPTITSAASINYDGIFTITTTGSPTPDVNIVGTLPPGLSFVDNGDGTATINGQPTVTSVSTYQVTVNATSVAGAASQTLEITVAPPFAIVSPATVTFDEGSGGTFTVEAPGTPTPTLSYMGTLPSGVGFTDNGDGTASISGMPTTPGSFEVTVTASNAFGTQTQDLDVIVDGAPTFTGSTSTTLEAGQPDQEWDFSATGFPVPSYGLGGLLPAGLSFVDNGDGTASISGTPDLGTSGTYPLTLTIGNSSGETDVALTLVIDEPANIPSLQSTPQVHFPVGTPVSYTVTATGSPVPSMSATLQDGVSPLPSWLTATDNGDGTLTLSGTAPRSALGDNIGVAITATNTPGYFTGYVQITVPSIGVTNSPPAASVGEPYSFQFNAAGSGARATYRLEAGQLPTGLALSGSGLLSGMATTLGSSSFTIIVSSGGQSATETYTLSVVTGTHPLEISQFRLYGPGGGGDWYADIENTTSGPISLSSFELSIALEDGSSAFVRLGNGLLAPGGQFLVEGPESTYGSSLTPGAFGPGLVAIPGGLSVVSTDGTVSDSVGEVGASAGFVEGTGLAVPSGSELADGEAYIRVTTGTGLQDTENNANDFVLGAAAPVSYISGGNAHIQPGAERSGQPIGISGSAWTDSSATAYECAVAYFSASQCDQNNRELVSLTKAASGNTYLFAGAQLTLASGVIDANNDNCGLASSPACYVVVVGASGEQAEAGVINFVLPAAALVWSPTTTARTYTFGTLDAGAGATKSATFTLTNSGGSNTGDLMVTLPASTAFTITANACTGVSLGPTQSCSVTLEFAPKKASAAFGSTLVAQSSSVAAGLSLNGSSGTPVVAWSRAHFAFGTVPDGTTTTQTFTLTNSGTGTAAPATVALEGAGSFSILRSEGTCQGIELSPGQSCQVTVQFAPTVAGAFFGASLRATGTGSRFIPVISLSGTGGVG